MDRRPGMAADAVRSLLAQRRLPDRLVTVLAGAAGGGDGGGDGGLGEPLHAVRDEVARLADDAGVPAAFLHGPVPAVAGLLAATGAPAGHQADPGREAAAHWLWWMHDDALADPAALERLLGVVEASPSVTVAGCKQVELDRPRHLLDVGLAVTGAGEPISLIEPGELDQGQYDARTDVFAVSAPGLLVRADVWDALRGPDPAAPAPAAAVDLCWRARLAGHRVVVVPGAVVRHAAEGEGLYAGPAALRESSVWLRLKHARPLAVPLLWAWSLLAGIAGFAGSLLAKEPGRGAARLAGTLRTLVRPVPLARARAQARRTRTAPRGVVAPLRAGRRQVRSHRRSVLELESVEEVIGDGTGSTGTGTEATGGHDDFTALATPGRNWVGTGLVAVVLLLAALSIAGTRHLLGAPALAGGSLLPVSGSPAELWRHATDGWAPAGVGAPVQPGPFGLVLAVLGATGNGSAVLAWLTVLAMPLAGAGAWFAAGAVERGRGVRVLAGLLWGLSPALVTASGQGRPGSLLVHLALPWLALAVIHATGSAAPRRPDPEGHAVDARPRPGRRGVVSWTASGWTALLLAGLGAAAPALLPPLVAAVLVLAAVLRRRGRTLWWTPLPALALFLPVLLAHWTDLRAVLGDPGVPQASAPAAPWQQVLGFPEAFAPDSGLLALPWLDAWVPGTPWALAAALVLGAPPLAMAAAGAVRRGRAGRLARAGLLVALVALAGGTLAPLVATSLAADGRLVTVSTGPFTSLAAMGVLLAAVSGLNGYRGARVPLRAALAMLGAAGACSVLLAAGLWTLPRTLPGGDLEAAGAAALQSRAAAGEHSPELSGLGAGSEVAPSPVRLIPATAADQGTSALATRTLVLERGAEELRAGLAAGSGPSLDRLSAGWAARSLAGPLTDPRPAAPDAADEQLRSLAAGLVSGTTADPRPALESLGAAFVVLRDPDGREAATAASIDAVPGLAPVGLTDSGWLWRVVPDRDGGIPVAGEHGLRDRLGFTTARVRIEDAAGDTTQLVARRDGRVDTRIAAGEDGRERRLVLAERADPGWHATLDGTPLERAPVAEGEWAQAFELPAEGGRLVVWQQSASAVSWAWWVPAVLLLLATLLAVPSPARRSDARPRAPLAGPARPWQDLEGELGGPGDDWADDDADDPEGPVDAQRPAGPGAPAPAPGPAGSHAVRAGDEERTTAR
ncbi:glycosyltransferase family 2 protein [Citricoccus sp. SGAir0253]|uniref:glycosyltransferase n=1 Tax=Citricoccus sp. SGAir0253 TaxID=2567881 RepID=UPI0010CD40BE|nr:glycosyltransferase family 2 protein [Citricoccus sp. SGAir0253]